MLSHRVTDRRLARHEDELRHHLRINGNGREQRPGCYDTRRIRRLPGAAREIVGPGKAAHVKDRGDPAAQIRAMEMLRVSLQCMNYGVIGVFRSQIECVRPAVKPAGLRIVHMGIYQTRADVGAVEVYRSGARGPGARSSSAGTGNSAVVDDDVGIGDRARARINEGSVPKAERTGGTRRGSFNGFRGRSAASAKDEQRHYGE